MAERTSPYRPLPGKARSLWGRSRLFAAADHLLLAREVAFTEHYRRFYFKDIRAVTLRITRVRAIWALVLAALWLVTDVPLLILGGGGVRLFGAALAALYLLLWAVNWLRGPTCSVHVQTAVQTERLTGVTRLRQARRLLDQIHPLIEEAQGRLSLEQIRAALSSPAPPPVKPEAFQ